MSRRVSSILEIIVALGIFWIGINNMNFLFITGTRSAAITLGIIGLLFYLKIINRNCLQGLKFKIRQNN